MVKTGRPVCQYGDSIKDDAKYTFFECSRWHADRQRLMVEIGYIAPVSYTHLDVYKRQALWKFHFREVHSILLNSDHQKQVFECNRVASHTEKEQLHLSALFL